MASKAALVFLALAAGTATAGTPINAESTPLLARQARAVAMAELNFKIISTIS